MLLFDQFLTPIFKSKFTVQPIHLIMIVVCFTRQELTCEWRHCKRGSSACESNHFLRLSRWVFSGSALPHRTSLRNLTLVVGRHYTSHNIFLQNIDTSVPMMYVQHKNGFTTEEHITQNGFTMEEHILLRGADYLSRTLLQAMVPTNLNFIVNCKLYLTCYAF